MKHSIIYRCAGICGGVSHIEKKCGAETCDRFDHPLQAVEQCEPCAAAAQKDGKAHACKACVNA